MSTNNGFWNKLTIAGICLFAAFAVAVSFFSERGGEITADPSIQVISPSDARAKMDEHQDAFILDVRSSGEFYASRIPGAVNIPYLMIESGHDLLPLDKHTQIFVYCRTGRRATTAANKLAELGYTNIIVFPGMISWVYETVSG